jgi:glutamate dehydrogenase
MEISNNILSSLAKTNITHLLMLYAAYINRVLAVGKTVGIDNISAENRIKLYGMFDSAFNPINFDKNPSLLKAVLASDFDAIKQSFDSHSEVFLIAKAIAATVRTNFYMLSFDDSNNDEKAIIIQLFSPNIREKTELEYESFVYGKHVEGVNFRSSKVSRGGMRWSSRDDYATEILGLARAQIQKNAPIVPTGSKGGFIVKDDYDTRCLTPSNDQGIRAYKTFIRALLSNSDNRNSKNLNDTVLRPKYIVSLNGDDAYLAIGPDKGTATFSDMANDISENEYGFWLGNAFASGGSVGYDHKRLGITSRGSLIAAEHHFSNIALKLYEDNLTVVGVGGLSGDVFGNAMTILNQIRLIAAFSHSHIFIDPTPNIQTSYAERLRLFQLEKSWNAYDTSLISSGGGIFEINQSEIHLSNEMRTLLGIDIHVCSGSELVCHILRCSVDLLFFGGIGTFIKSSNETDESVSDKERNIYRVNACDINARVICEGANLACTTDGRIEYARVSAERQKTLKNIEDNTLETLGLLHASVGINTEAIDNFAGVNCSDHEVNIKILLIGFDSETKAQLIQSVESEVVDLVLQVNVQRNIGVYTDTLLSAIQNNEYNFAIEKLVQLGFLNSSVAINYNKFGVLSRPEASLLISYMSNYLVKLILNGNVCDVIPESYLVDYFPKTLHSAESKTYLYENVSNIAQIQNVNGIQPLIEDIKHFILRKEIMATQFIAQVVDAFGSVFVLSVAHSLNNGKTIEINICKVLSVISSLSDIGNILNERIAKFKDMEQAFSIETFLRKRILDAL